MTKLREELTDPNLIGKYVNRYLYTDVHPVGKIIGRKGKTILIVQRVTHSENKTKMITYVGGFSGHTVNNYNQEYDYTLTDEILEIRLTKSNRQLRVDDHPVYFYDYNF